MLCHFTKENGRPACGTNGVRTYGSRLWNEVTCKKCLENIARRKGKIDRVLAAGHVNQDTHREMDDQRSHDEACGFINGKERLDHQQDYL